MNLYELDEYIQYLIDNEEQELLVFYSMKREELVKKIKLDVFNTLLRQ